jgi:hypothetical protein
VTLRATVEDERRNVTREGDRRRRILGRPGIAIELTVLSAANATAPENPSLI